MPTSELSRLRNPWLRWSVTLTLPWIALGILWCSRPTPVTLSRFTTTLEGRSPAQIRNIATAAAALDQILIQPDEIFSFNQVVGPRTLMRGYVEAPAFMTASTLDSVGGGICQVSSSLYKAALQAGLIIEERQAHFTTIQSVPPGFDATVWYDQVDLKFRNPYQWPVRITTTVRPNRLIIQLLGKDALQPSTLRVEQNPFNQNYLHVRVYRDQESISDDIYYLNVPNR